MDAELLNAGAKVAEMPRLSVSSIPLDSDEGGVSPVA